MDDGQVKSIYALVISSAQGENYFLSSPDQGN
jgi:hypothetical protein